MAIAAGNLNAKIRIQARHEKQDSMGQRSESWQTLATRRANIRALSMGESKTLTGETSSVTYEIKVRSDSATKTISPDDRVVDVRTGNVYDVEASEDMLSMGKIITLRCKYVSRGVEHLQDNAQTFTYDLPLTLG